MLDQKGNLITSAKAIEALAVETYKKRLENRQIKDALKHIEKDKEELCRLRLKIASRNKTPDWTMDQLETVLEYLKKDKSRDPLGFANEIFHPDVAGDDLKKAIIVLLNRYTQRYWKCMIYPLYTKTKEMETILKIQSSNFQKYLGQTYLQ